MTVIHLIRLSQWLVPLLILVILGVGFQRGVKVYEVFIQGALEGLKTTFKLTPYILAIFVAIGLFRNSGALQVLLNILTPLLNLLHIPGDLLTLGLLKPLSGSAALGTTAEILTKYGPDSPMGLTASILQGSCETTFYVISLYLGSVQIKDGRHILMVGLLCETVVFITALLIGPLIGG